MKTLKEMLKPRASVYSDTNRDDVLNLTNFANGDIDPVQFFSENFKTQGMQILFNTAMDRFKGKSDIGVIKLTQAMGGGKTHNMLALALLAKHKELRATVLGEQADGIEDITVVAFSGRERPQFGIWGYIAQELGKEELFKEFRTSLTAPGESDWIELLQGENILILMDELPPYLVDVKSVTVGSSDLSAVTVAALSNLFSALGKKELAKVCLVFSDLRAAYEDGSELLAASFRDLEAEANRSAIDVSPVALNTDEVYSILKKRLFEDSVSSDFDQNVEEIARAYEKSVANTKKILQTPEDTGTIYEGVVDAYPFHPSIKNLYGRFKENQNFQETRGLIKLMRQIVRKIYETGKADEKLLINVFDLDLNDVEIKSQFQLITPSLEEAISYDIAQNEKSIAETIDKAQFEGNPVAQEVAKLILMSSLSTTSNGILGLTESEILECVSSPTSDVSKSKSSLDLLMNQCWYIKTDNSKKIFFQESKNLLAVINSKVNSYSIEKAREEVKKILETKFQPTLHKCYQNLYVLPTVSNIKLDTNKISLVVYEAHSGTGLHPDLLDFYDASSEKNRVMFLTGQQMMLDSLYLNAKKLKAIEEILKDLNSKNVSTTDAQYQEAEKQKTLIEEELLTTITKTFNCLYFPSFNKLKSVDFNLQVQKNSPSWEEQIVTMLKDKYEELTNVSTALDIMRGKCESRLFSASDHKIKFSRMLECAATNTEWQWYHPDQMKRLKADAIAKDQWREIDGYIHKGPFAKDPTSVRVTQKNYDDTTGEFVLDVIGMNGTVYCASGVTPTESSTKVTNTVFTTKETTLQFICIDSNKEYPTGEEVTFIGNVPTEYEQKPTSNGLSISLKTHPSYVMKYSTDGSDPEEETTTYTGECTFTVDEKCRIICVVVSNNVRVVERTTFTVIHNKDGEKNQISIEKDKQLTYRYKQKRKMDTATTFVELTNLSQLSDVQMQDIDIDITSQADKENYITFSSTIPSSAERLREIIELIRKNNFSEEKDASDVVDSTDTVASTVQLSYKTLMFGTGESFLRWLNLNNFKLEDMETSGEIKQ